jgi:hypothetical protein
VSPEKESESQMSLTRYPLRRAAVVLVASAGGLVAPTVSHAAPPTVATDHGAYVRLVGNPSDGTAKFQFGWSESTPASGAAGYWLGVYDVTHSRYIWSADTGPIDLPDGYFRNARPTAELPNGDYKVVFFVRGTYEPATNISIIELPFSVHHSDD